MTGYDFHPGARFDLAGIWEFIGADNLDAAEQVIGATLRNSRLARFSYVGRGHPDLTVRPLHFISVREYLTAYAPEGKPCGLSP